MQNEINDIVFDQVCEIPDHFNKEISFLKTPKSSPDDIIKLFTNAGILIEKAGNITHCKADGNYTKVYRANEKPVLIRARLKDIEQILKGQNFVKCHRSFIVNIDYIREISGKLNSTIILLEGEKIPCSKNHILQLHNAFKLGYINIHNYLN